MVVAASVEGLGVGEQVEHCGADLGDGDDATGRVVLAWFGAQSGFGDRVGNLWLEADEAEAIVKRYDRLATVALTPADSASLIRKILKGCT